MVYWFTIRRIVTLVVLMMATSEIFACQLISPDSCIFSAHQHTSGDPDDGCSGDGCLCCCAHIVVVAPITPLASLGVSARALPLSEIETPNVPRMGIEHPPRS